jgi:hypothetical protein
LAIQGIFPILAVLLSPLKPLPNFAGQDGKQIGENDDRQIANLIAARPVGRTGIGQIGQAAFSDRGQSFPL